MCLECISLMVCTDVEQLRRKSNGFRETAFFITKRRIRVHIGMRLEMRLFCLSWAAFCQYHFMFYVKRFVWDGSVWQIAPVCFFIYAWELQRRGEWNAVKCSLQKWKRNRNSSRYFKRTPAAPWAAPTQRQPSKELHLFSLFYLMYKDFYSASYYLRRMNLWKSFSEEGYSYPQGENGYV